MKANLWLIFIAAILSAVQIKAQDVQVATTTKTNLETKTVIITDTYTRNEKTNLVRRIIFQKGVIQGGTQKLYHDGLLLGTVITAKNENVLSVVTEPNPIYSVSFDLRSVSDQRLESASIMDTNATVIDSFTSTNGLLIPLEISKIEKFNQFDNETAEFVKPTVEQENQIKNLAEKWKNLLISTKTIKCAALLEK